MDNHNEKKGVAVEPRTSVDIGLIIALKEEGRELLGLVEDYEPLSNGGMNSYFFTYAEYRCVASIVGLMGELEATRVTERQIGIWDPASIVVIGISGGLHGDLRVGDAYIPGQIVQYIQNAKGTPTEMGGFHIAHGAPAIRPDHILYTKASGFDLNHPTLYRRWRDDCRKDLESLIPSATARERLFIDDLVRAEVELLATGHEASGPIVSAAPAFSDWIRSVDRNVKALDMETAAVLTTAQSRPVAKPALAIRGISDYGDDRKTKLDAIGDGSLRKYAMRSAVRFLWALLEAKVFPQMSAESNVMSHNAQAGAIDPERIRSKTSNETMPVRLRISAIGSAPHLDNGQPAMGFTFALHNEGEGLVDVVRTILIWRVDEEEFFPICVQNHFRLLKGKTLAYEDISSQFESRALRPRDTITLHVSRSFAMMQNVATRMLKNAIDGVVPNRELILRAAVETMYCDISVTCRDLNGQEKISTFRFRWQG